MDEDEEPLRVVSDADYRPRLNPVLTGAASAAPQTLIDPITGQAVPADRIQEHMRVQLLDPRWRVEQQRFQDKQKSTGLVAGGDSISENLRVFAQHREDLIAPSAAAQRGAQLPAPGLAAPTQQRQHPPPPPPPPPPQRPEEGDSQPNKRGRK